ncbi:hypothetical protein M5W70_16060 [Paenibacillus larvae]|uniref:hypothetical protein n=1 Tax=Paenibacillus larvae TaxID=1464 RepID=UPI0001694671|nr:hypothetical protein [Paenibacillus larvae]MCY9690164.1 hypothetical protein [Paenibacillus larvae]MDV3485650.1 hypothetical protein [Paenibacillus larvae]
MDQAVRKGTKGDMKRYFILDVPIDLWIMIGAFILFLGIIVWRSRQRGSKR